MVTARIRIIVGDPGPGHDHVDRLKVAAWPGESPVVDLAFDHIIQIVCREHVGRVPTDEVIAIVVGVAVAAVLLEVAEIRRGQHAPGRLLDGSGRPTLAASPGRSPENQIDGRIAHDEATAVRGVLRPVVRGEQDREDRALFQVLRERVVSTCPRSPLPEVTLGKPTGLKLGIAGQHGMKLLVKGRMESRPPGITVVVPLAARRLGARGRGRSSGRQGSSRTPADMWLRRSGARADLPTRAPG